MENARKEKVEKLRGELTKIRNEFQTLADETYYCADEVTEQLFYPIFYELNKFEQENTNN